MTQKQMKIVRLKTGVEQSVKECRYRMTTTATGEPNGENRNDDQPHLLTQSHPQRMPFQLQQQSKNHRKPLRLPLSPALSIS